LIYLCALLVLIACGPAPEAPGATATPIADGEGIDQELDSAAVNSGDSAEITPSATVPPTAQEIAADTIDLSRVLGDPAAPLTLVEYSDFQCPFCQRHHQQTIPRLVETFIDSGRLRYEFRDFPIAGLHPLAYRLHEAARCATEAGGNDAFWQAHDLFFDQADRFQVNSLSAMDAAIDAAFADSGLPSVTECLTENRYAAAVQADTMAGQNAGVSGTPAFFLEGYPISGAQPYEVFAEAIIAAEEGRLAALFQPTPPPPPQAAPTPAVVGVRADTALGDPNAPVQIIEFSDFQCPFCRRHHQETVPQLQPLIESGRVYYVFRDFPIASLHPLAYKLHEAALCVRDKQGVSAFWQAHDLFFDQAETFQQSNDGGMDTAISTALTSADLWDTDTEQCYVNGETAAEVDANIAEAAQLGITGTPSFFINGYLVVGAQPIAVFEYAIELAEEGRLADAFRPSGPQDGKAQATATAQAAQPVDVPLSGNEPMKGLATAPVTIVEYSDYQCPFCLRHFEQTMPQIQQYIDDGQVRYIFKDFPLTQIHPQAYKVHEAAHCAREQGGDTSYWEAHDLFFVNQSLWAGATIGPHVDVIKGLATQLRGLDQAAFESCLDSDRYAETVQANLDEGIALGVRGTPSFFVNGRFINGAQPFSVFQQVIDQALSE
jgi:protein-disulfide isomerase